MSQASQLQKLNQTLRESSPVQSLRQMLSQPTSVGILISVGLHAVVVASIPFLAQSNEAERDRRLDANVVELTPQELQQFAPSATQEFGLPSQNFEFDGNLPPSLSNRPSFPPPPPADTQEETPGSIWDRWSSWENDYAGSPSTGNSSGRSDRDNDNDYSSGDSWSQYQRQWDEWLNNNSTPNMGQPGAYGGTERSPGGTTQDDEETFAQRKKIDPSTGSENTEDATGTETEGDNTDETQTAGTGRQDGDFDSGSGYQAGIDVLDDYYAWVQSLYTTDETLEDRLVVWEERDPQPIEGKLPPQQAYQVLAGQQVYAGVVVSPEGEIENIQTGEGAELNPMPLPMGSSDRVLDLALEYTFSEHYNFPQSDRPRAYWFLVRFQALEETAPEPTPEPNPTNPPEKQPNAEGTPEGSNPENRNPTPGESTPPMKTPGTGNGVDLREGFAYIQPLGIPEEAQRRWLTWLRQFEIAPTLTEQPIQQVRVVVPPEVTPQPQRVVFAIAISPEGTLVEDRLLPLQLTGNPQLDERARAYLSSDEASFPASGELQADLFVVEFVPSNNPNINGSTAEDSSTKPMQKKPPVP